jgi:hypothetical protein
MPQMYSVHPFIGDFTPPENHPRLQKPTFYRVFITIYKDNCYLNAEQEELFVPFPHHKKTTH